MLKNGFHEKRTYYPQTVFMNKGVLIQNTTFNKKGRFHV